MKLSRSSVRVDKDRNKQRLLRSATFKNYGTAFRDVNKLIGHENAPLQNLNEIAGAVERHISRSRARSAIIADPLDVKPGRMIRAAEERLKPLVQPLVRQLYRGSATAGGETLVEVNVGYHPGASGRTSQVGSSKYGTRHVLTHLSVTVSPRWRSEVGAIDGLSSAGGMLTTHARGLASNLWEASWVTQGRGFGLGSTYGYIARLQDGSFAHSTRLDVASRLANSSDYRPKSDVTKTSENITIIIDALQVADVFASDPLMAKSHCEEPCEIDSGKAETLIPNQIPLDEADPNVEESGINSSSCLKNRSFRVLTYASASCLYPDWGRNVYTPRLALIDLSSDRVRKDLQNLRGIVNLVLANQPFFGPKRELFNYLVYEAGAEMLDFFDDYDRRAVAPYVELWDDAQESPNDEGDLDWGNVCVTLKGCRLHRRVSDDFVVPIPRKGEWYARPSSDRSGALRYAGTELMIAENGFWFSQSVEECSAKIVTPLLPWSVLDDFETCASTPSSGS